VYKTQHTITTFLEAGTRSPVRNYGTMEEWKHATKREIQDVTASCYEQDPKYHAYIYMRPVIDAIGLDQISVPSRRSKIVEVAGISL